MSYPVRCLRFALALFPLAVACCFMRAARIVGGKDMRNVLREAARGVADV